MRHLGDRLSALIDGELSASQRERGLSHLARCERCRQEAVALRLLKRCMLALGEATAYGGLADDSDAVGGALTCRLIALAGATGVPVVPGNAVRSASWHGRRARRSLTRRKWP